MGKVSFFLLGFARGLLFFSGNPFLSFFASFFLSFKSLKFNYPTFYSRAHWEAPRILRWGYTKNMDIGLQMYCKNLPPNEQNCTTTIPYIEIVNATGGDFYIVKTWDYGELMIAFLLLFFILFYFAGAIFKFFFETFVRIKRKTD